MSNPTGQCPPDSFRPLFIYCFCRILLTRCPLDPIMLVSVLSLFREFLLGVLNMGHWPGSYERILLCSRSPPPPPVTSSALQLVSELVRSLVVLNKLCDPKATWRKAPSSLCFSMVEILVIGRTL
jgi:hypothetical protein